MILFPQGMDWQAIVPAIIGRDRYEIGFVTSIDDDEITQVMSILGMVRFHRLCNTVLSYPAKSATAAWLAYAPRYVEERVSAERQRVYDTTVARPAFGTLYVYNGAEERAGIYGPSEDEQASRVNSAAYVR